MKKIVLKKSFILCIILFFLELLNLIILYVLRSSIAYFLSKSTNIDNVYNVSEAISYIVLIIFSLFCYYYIGRKIFAKFGSKNIKKYVAIISSIIIILSYPFSEFITRISGEYFIIHLMVCSPIAYVMSIPFSANEIIWVVFLALISPISVLFIWLFSKNEKLKNDV